MVICWNIDGLFGISGFNEELYVVIWNVEQAI
jgi:hypothetical protein